MEKKTGPRAYSVPFVRGATIAALILTIFGAFWGFMVLFNSNRPPAWAFVLIGLISLTLMIFSIKRLTTLSKISTPSPDEQARRKGRMQGMWFGIIFTVEGLLIAATSILLANANLTSVIPIAVAAIVGLHFLPLAKVFGVPIYYLTGFLLFGFACVSFAIPNEATRLGALGTVVAIVLWTSALIILVTYSLHTV